MGAKMSDTQHLKLLILGPSIRRSLDISYCIPERNLSRETYFSRKSLFVSVCAMVTFLAPCSSASRHMSPFEQTSLEFMTYSLFFSPFRIQVL